jgi:competence protein ComEC
MIKIHFLNVGQGDCIVIEFKDPNPNRTAVIDINMTGKMDDDTYAEIKTESINSLSPIDLWHHQIRGYTDSQLFEKAGYDITLTNPITYIKNLKPNSVFRFISTHPHMDHLSGLNNLKSEIGIRNIWIIRNEFTQILSELNDSQKVDWGLYKKYRDTMESQLDGTTIVRPEESDSNQFWNEDKITILAPNPTLLQTAKDNDNRNIMSYVLLIEYYGHKIILGGDAEEDTWKFIYEKYPNLIKDVTILKASHHGRDSGFYQPAIKQMNPEYTIVSVGKKPDTDASNKYRQYSRHVWTTRLKGTIIFELNADGSGTYSFEYNRQDNPA